MNQILNAARLQYVGWRTRLLWPWFILAISFTANLVLFASIGADTSEVITGGLLSIYTVELIFASQLMTQVLSLALSLSMTRKHFYLAALLSIVARAVAFGVVLAMLKLVEDATNGWGVTLRFFRVPFVAQDNVFRQILVYAMLFILLNLIGTFTGVIFKRWGLNGMFTVAIVTTVVVVGVVSLLTWRLLWHETFDWFAGQPTIVLIAGWPVVLALLMAAGGFLAIRRTTPA